MSEKTFVSTHTPAPLPGLASTILHRLPRRRLYVGLALLCGVHLLALAPLQADAQDATLTAPFDKVGTDTLTIDGANIRDGESYVMGGTLAQTSGDTYVDYLGLGEGAGNTGALNVSGGALTFGTALQVGDFGGTGTVTQTGGTVAIIEGCGDTSHCPSLNIGNQGGTGTYDISGGSLSQAGGFVILGRNDSGRPASSGTLNISGAGTVAVTDGGALFIGDNLISGSDAGTGTINQTGGTLTIDNSSRLYLAAGGDGTYNLNGGTLQIGGSSLLGSYNGAGGQYSFNLGGGTVQVIGSTLDADVNANLVAGTSSTIDTSGLGANWTGTLSGEGGLAKAGAGTLTLTNANSYTGLTTITGGTLALTGTGSIAGTSGLALGSGGTFDISQVTTPVLGTDKAGVSLPNLSGSGTIDNGTNALVVGSDNSSTSFSGTIHNDGLGWGGGDFGTFTKVGTGTLTISGATIEGGESYVMGGALAQTSGDTQINYLAVGEGTGNTGALNVSGGTLTFGTGMQVGDWGGTGTVTQTGGNVVIAAGCGDTSHCPSLNIGNQGGTGTYDISGGSLSQAGGFMVIGRNESGEPASTGTLNISGTGAVAVTDSGALFIGDNLLMTGGASAGTGTIDQTGGTLTIDGSSRLYLAASGNGAYNLDGGTLQIGGSSLYGNYNNAGGSYAFNLGGGTIQVIGSALAADVDATLVGGTTSAIDTNGLGATWTGVLSGGGGLAKAGAGTLTLTNANSYTGLTTITGGTLALTGTGSIAGTSGLALGSGGTFDISGVTTTIAGTDMVGVLLPSLSGSGTVDNGTHTLVVGSDNSSTSFSGTIHNDGVGWGGAPYGSFLKVGTGTLDVSGATIEGGESYVVGGALAQTGGDTRINYLAVGEGTGNTGALNVSGGTLSFGTALQVGDFGGTGTVTQTGGNVVIAAGCGDRAHCPALNIGNQGGNGTYAITGGSLSQNDGVVVIGRNDASHAASTGLLSIGGTGAVSIGGTGKLIVGDNLGMTGVSTAGSGTISQTGGILAIGADAQLYLSASGNGTYNLDGGTLQVGGSSLQGSYNNAGGSYAFNLGGGTIQATGSALAADVDATLAGGTTSAIDTNGLGATWTGVLSGGGTLAKAGAGTLTLAGANTYSGGTRLDAGTLTVGNAAALGSGTLAMAEATTLDFAGSYTLPNAITVSGDPTINIGAGQNVVLSGAISDGSAPGDIVKTGDGVLSTTAANSYTGATTVSQGTLALVGDGSIAASSRVVVDANLDISGTSAGAAITSLAGNGTVALGARPLTLTAASDSFGGVIAGSGGLTLAGGRETLTGTNTYTGPTAVAGGELQVEGSLASAVTVSGSGRLSGNGSVGGLNVGAGSVIAPGGQAIGTLTVNGDYNQAAGAAYEAQLAPDGSADLIAVSGAANLADGAILEATRSAGGIYALGSRYTVLTAAGGVNGRYTLAGDTALSAFYSLQESQDANNVYLGTVQTRAFADAGRTRNQLATAVALDALPTASVLRNAVGSSATDEAARGAFDQLSGEIHAAVKTALIEQSSFARDAADDRLRQAFCVSAGHDTNVKAGRLDGQAADACNADGVVVWQRTFGSWGHTGGDGNAARLQRSDSGFFLGADTPVADAWRIGVFGGYDQSTFAAAQRRGSGTSDNYDLGLYGGAQWNRLGLRLGATYSSQNIRTDRAVAFDGYSDALHGGYHGGTSQVFGELGYQLRTGALRIEPFAGAAYVNLHTDSFDEHGGEAALRGRSDDTGVAFSTLGVRPSAAFEVGGATLTVDGMLGWRHAYGSRTPTSELSYAGGDAFTVAGVPVARNAAVVEAGIDASIRPDLTLGLSYSGQFGGGVRDQGFRANLSLKF